jgi:hypothetical protein
MKILHRLLKNTPAYQRQAGICSVVLNSISEVMRRFALEFSALKIAHLVETGNNPSYPSPTCPAVPTPRFLIDGRTFFLELVTLINPFQNITPLPPLLN